MMDPSNFKTFTAVLEPLQTGLGWVVARVPFDVATAWPVRKGLRVRGEISAANGQGSGAKSGDGGMPIRTSLMAYAGGGGHFLLVNQKMQAAARVGAGSKVRIRLEPDLEERPAMVPAELAKALKGDRRLRKWFDGLSESYRRDIGKWVSAPKSAASREQRAERMAERLLLTLEGETELPPILHAAFLRQPQARAGWEAMTTAQRRNHLLGIFYYQGVEARENRVAKAVEDALRVAGRGSRA
jgi:uncharacterized protein YdeI (YjbR/CyaY-like superfamily)